MFRRPQPSAGQLLMLPGFEEPTPPTAPPLSVDPASDPLAGLDAADRVAADAETEAADEPSLPRADEFVRSSDVPPTVTKVVRSNRRTRTVGWHVRNGVLQITIPNWMSAKDEARWIADIEQRTARKQAAKQIDLRQRAATLAKRYSLPIPAEIKWSDDMLHRWGSCTPSTRVVRISSRIVPFPAWVLDYVIVHELAHIAVPDHSPEFWTIVHRYPKAERATGYLIAKAGDDETLDD